MASNSGNMSGLLVLGAVLTVAAIAIKAGLRDGPVQDDAPDVAQADSVARADSMAQADGVAQANSSTESTHPALQGDQKMFGFTKTQKTGGAVDHASDTNFQEKVLEAEGRVLVDFYADWCGPCRMIAPVLEELAREVPNARIVKVNVDDSPNLARHFGIESIPALIVFENGRAIEQRVGVASKSELRRMLVN